MATMTHAASSIALLEPDRIETLDVDIAMKRLATPRSRVQPSSESLYGVVVFPPGSGKTYKAVWAIYEFLSAYRKASQVLSHHRSWKPATRNRSFNIARMDGVQLFVDTEAPWNLRDRPEPVPGVYILASKLNHDLLKSLRLEPFPKPFRDMKMVVLVDELVNYPSSSAVLTFPAAQENVGLENPTAEEDDSFERETLEWRSSFMSSYPSVTSSDIGRESSRARNIAATASRWLKDKKIFAVRFKGQQWFPKFQFQDGFPTPAVSKVIRTFPDHATGWDLAYFFTNPNPYIDGRKPVELLRSNPDRVISLAEAFAHPADVF